MNTIKKYLLCILLLCFGCKQDNTVSTIDCLGTINGGYEIDDCGECNNMFSEDWNSSCEDCSGVIDGDAWEDDCGQCVCGPFDNPVQPENSNCLLIDDTNGDNMASESDGEQFIVGLDDDSNPIFGNWDDYFSTIPCAIDCNGDLGGPAYLDECAECAGYYLIYGTPGNEQYYLIAPQVDFDEDGLCDGYDYDGDGQCDDPAGCDLGEDPCLGSTAMPDCNQVCGGVAVFDGDGACCTSGALDCADICDGAAVVDECDACDGPGIPGGECDCNGNIDDACGNCGGDCTDDGNGFISCNDDSDNSITSDCLGVCGGSATLDGNSDCCASGIVDCNGLCDGTASLDCANVCDGSGIEDCNGDCDGSATTDGCGVCWGGNSIIQEEDSTLDCNSVCGGPALPDSNGVCCLSGNLDCNNVCDGTASVWHVTYLQILSQ